MKKIALTFCLLFLVSCCFLSGCKDTPSLYGYVYELQSDVFEGQSQNYNLKAVYGYKTENEKIYRLTIKMVGKEADNATYTLSLDYGGKNYRTEFALNPVTGNLTAKLEIEDFTAKEFSVTVTYSSEIESVTLKSLLPSDCADPKTAVDSLFKSQTDLIANYYDGETFNGKIVMRALVKNDKPYWYVGLEKPSGDVKALLVDGISLEVLAIRDIF